MLLEVFEREPPLVARQHQAQGPLPARQHSGAPPPIPPLPPELESATKQPLYVHKSSQQRQPQAPPKPPKGESALSKYDRPAPLPPRIQESESGNGVSVPYRQEGRTSAPNRVIRDETQEMNGSSQQHNDWQRGDYVVGQPSWQGYAEPRSPVSPMDSRLPPAAAQIPSVRYSHNSPYQQGQIATPFTQRPLSGQPTYLDGPQSEAQGSNQVLQYLQDRQNHTKVAQSPKPKPTEDLLTSPFETAIPASVANVPPPPIPPNPQKDALLSALSRTLTKMIQSTHASNASAISPLLAQQAALTSTFDAVSLEISQLNDLETLLSSNEAILHQAMHEADKVLEDAKRRKVPSVDDVLVAPTIVAGQLYQAVAEERAIEDCRGALGKALDRGKIGGVVWAKVWTCSHDLIFYKTC